MQYNARKISVCDIYVGRVVVCEKVTDVSSTARRRYADLQKLKKETAMRLKGF
jgi:hypothetical protein